MSRLVVHVVLVIAAGVWPLQPEPAVERGFDPPEVAWGAGHRGVDLRGMPGQPVRAALAGRITFARRIAGRGVVVVDHGETRTTYEPVSASVVVGAAVDAGEVIGTLDWFGTHCAPHACLHWGLIDSAEQYRDPLTLLGCVPRPVRLLPLDLPAPPTQPCDGPARPTLRALTRVLSMALTEALLRLAGALGGRPVSGGRW